MNSNRTSKNYLLLYLKGLAMGAADVIPGVSGGTIAFITGIYEELIHSLRQAGSSAATLLLKGKIAAFYREINGNFLVVLFAGIGTSILLLSNLVLYLLENQAIAVWSFFFGLIVASSIIIYKKIRNHNFSVILSAVVGIAAAWWITSASPTETRTDLWFILLCGAVAICAMILPGISGSFILLLMGKYQFILTSLKEFKIGIIVTFAAGCVIGLVSFSHALDWLLKKYHDLTVALLAGFMIGSLNKVWPWKETLSTVTDSSGHVKPLIERNVNPFHFTDITGQEPQLVLAAALCLTAFLVVYILEMRGNRIKA